MIGADGILFDSINNQYEVQTKIQAFKRKVLSLQDARSSHQSDATIHSLKDTLSQRDSTNNALLKEWMLCDNH